MQNTPSATRIRKVRFNNITWIIDGCAEYKKKKKMREKGKELQSFFCRWMNAVENKMYVISWVDLCIGINRMKSFSHCRLLTLEIEFICHTFVNSTAGFNSTHFVFRIFEATEEKVFFLCVFFLCSTCIMLVKCGKPQKFLFLFNWKVDKEVMSLVKFLSSCRKTVLVNNENDKIMKPKPGEKIKN